MMNISQQLNTPLNDLIARRKKQQPQNSSPAKPQTARKQSRRRKVQLRRDPIQVLRQPSKNVAGKQSTSAKERKSSRRKRAASLSAVVASQRTSANATACVARSLKAVPDVNNRKRVSHPAVTATTRIIINRDTNEQTIVLKRDTPNRTRSGDDMKGFKMANLKWCVCYK
ncbi:hypothetical protein WA538_001070, partial [Blastocystis sp. DL]